jgi:predicted DsbA family dithiol-disulfide isomerase
MQAIEVYADIWCPFAHVGLRAAADQRHRLGRDHVPIIVRAWPLELINGEPMGAEKAAHHAADLRQQVTPTMFRSLDIGHFPTTTLPALALASHAYEIDAHTGERVSFALRDALFEDGLDISDPLVLVALAERHGLGRPTSADEERVLADWQHGVDRGVVGSPHFFCQTGHEMFCPSLQIARDEEGQLDITQSAARLTAFLAGCFADGA